MSASPNLIEPLVGSRRRMMVRPSVDLPQPDSPTRPSVSPAWMSRVTSSTARTSAFIRVTARNTFWAGETFSPRGHGTFAWKCFETPRIWTRGSDIGEVTAHLGRADGGERRFLGAAAVLHRRATVLELAPDGERPQRRDHAGDLLEAPLLGAGFHLADRGVAGDRAEQARGVVVARRREQLG